MDIFKQKNRNGILCLSTITDSGTYYKRLYIQYTTRQAERMFGQYVKEQETQNIKQETTK